MKISKIFFVCELMLSYNTTEIFTGKFKIKKKKKLKEYCNPLVNHCIESFSHFLISSIFRFLCFITGYHELCFVFLLSSHLQQLLHLFPIFVCSSGLHVIFVCLQFDTLSNAFIFTIVINCIFWGICKVYNYNFTVTKLVYFILKNQ